jgi:methylenetetrahydrofolate reductase (NADPH)
MNAVVAPFARDELKRRVVEFLRGTSTEISPHDEGLIEELAGVLPPGTVVYVAHTPKAKIDDVVRVATKVQAHGLNASPHIVARRIDSERTLRRALEQLGEAGISQVLLVAGDLNPPAGSFTSTLQILDSGAIVDAGIKTVGVAGHPEGHPAVGPEVLWDALKHKQAFADRTGIRVHIATQFGFNPEGVRAWERQLTERGITLPIHAGIAGPTPIAKLIKFAVACGVGASFGSLIKNVGNMSKLASGAAASPEELLVRFVNAGAGTRESRIVQPHFYAFGGVMVTARWLRAIMRGAIELSAEGDKFKVDA